MNPHADTATRVTQHGAVTGKTLLFPVVGSPVSQVQAPRVFNALFALAGVDALVVPLELPAELVLETCRALLQSSSVGGILVTVPYKQTLFGIVDRAGDEAQLVGGVNAIRRSSDGQLVGNLFDGRGFVLGLRAAGHDPAGQRVLILGAGGAGSAIAAALAAAGADTVTLFDPRPGQADALAASLRTRYADCHIETTPSAIGRGFHVVVNASPLGMKASDPLPIDPVSLDAGTLVADVIMKPAETRLLQLAKERGCPTHPGQPMLDYQVPAYLEFFGLDEVARLAASMLREKRPTQDMEQT